MKKLIPLTLVFVLILSSLACNFGSKPTPQAAPTPVETDACCTNEPQTPPEQPTQPPAAPSSPAAPQASGLEPGWYAFTNANVARDVVVYKGVIHAATLGGLVTWRLDSGYAMRYTPLNGMGHVSANAIAYCEIPEPRILVGTLSGISVYDPNTGLWEKKLTFPAESRVDVSRIERLYCDQKNNRLLIGYSGLGVLDLKTGAFQRYAKDQGLLWDSVTDITVNGSDIWFASGYKGITQISGGKVKTYSAADGMPDERAQSLAFAKDGTLWVGASSGLQSFKGGKWTLYGKDTPAKLSDINELEIAADGKIWAATAPLGAGRLCQFNPQGGACDLEINDPDKQAILGLALDESGNPVYATSAGVSLVQNGQVKAFKTEDTLASNFVDSFATAPDGNLWVGTDGGIHIIDPANPSGTWQIFKKSTTQGLGGSWAAGIAFAPDGSAWVGVVNGYASHYKNGVWTNFPDIHSHESVTVDAEGRAWFGHPRKGIVVLNPDESVALTLTAAEGLPSDEVHALLTDSSGRVWIGTGKGLAKYENDALEVVFGPEDKTLPNAYIRALALDSGGALLIGTFTGVARYDGRETLTLLDLLKDGFSKNRLLTLEVGPNDQIWVGTDRGLLMQEGNTWKLFTTADGLLTNGISALHVDQHGAVWVGGGGSNFDGGGMLQMVP